MEEVPLAKSYLLLNHGPVTLVSSAANGRSNVMAAAWAMPLDFDPAKVLLVVDSNTLTRELIEASGEFALNIPCRRIADKVLAAGSVSGRDGDKFGTSGLETLAASRISAPLIQDCAAWLECRVIPEAHNQQCYDLFIAEVVAAWADNRVFRDGHWEFDSAPAELRTLHYVAGGKFFAIGESVAVK